MQTDTLYSVVVVEDEEVAKEHICTIINQRIAGFTVIATAENGKEALQVIDKTKPDLVVTDIHMPVMDGVKLIYHLAQDYPDIRSLVVSGYQDFPSVKGALTNGSLDYILKPLSPAKIQKAFNSIRETMQEQRRSHQRDLLLKLSRRVVISQGEKLKYFPHDEYYLAVERTNCLPGRFCRSFSLNRISFINDLIMLSGRDDREKIYLYPKQGEHPCCEFKHALRGQLEKEHAESPHSLVTFHTLACNTMSFPLELFAENLKTLLAFLDRHVVLECSQELQYDEQQEPQISPSSPEKEDLQQLELFLQENRFDDFRNELLRLLSIWKKERQTQLWVEGSLYQILRFTLKYAKKTNSLENYEFMLDEVFSDIASYLQLETKLLSLFEKIIKEDYGTFQKIDTPEFFLKVSEYITKHCAEHITLPDLCSSFGISQTYMSKLFRKYSGKSCNEYIKSLRLEKAMNLIKKCPNLQVKDIASIVGFKDQFYFSRLFHHEVGVSPSQFIHALRQEPDDQQ